MIKFQKSQALTSHLESFWSIVHYFNWVKGYWLDQCRIDLLLIGPDANFHNWSVF